MAIYNWLIPHSNASVHAITSKISPVHNSSGIEMLETDTFKLYCFQTLTGNVFYASCFYTATSDTFPRSSGTKFLLVTSPQQMNVDPYMKRIYDIYSDFVMKNPFHTPEMPIRSDQFDQTLLKFIQTVNGPWGKQEMRGVGRRRYTVHVRNKEKG